MLGLHEVTLSCALPWGSRVIQTRLYTVGIFILKQFWRFLESLSFNQSGYYTHLVGGIYAKRFIQILQLVTNGKNAMIYFCILLLCRDGNPNGLSVGIRWNIDLLKCRLKISQKYCLLI